MTTLTERKVLELTRYQWFNIAKNFLRTKPPSEFIHDCACCHYVVELVHGEEGKHILRDREMFYSMCQPVNCISHSKNIISTNCIDLCPMRELWPKGCERGDSPYLTWLKFQWPLRSALRIARHADKLLKELK